jgi:pimeloyl-ACP methyl ester carboxylesterase
MAFVVRFVGVLLVLTALAIPLVRAPDRPVETLVARWAPAPSDFVEVAGQVVHLRDEGPRGDPLPIVLLHGTAASLHTWEGWVRALKTSRRVITLDLPNFGLTGPFVGPPGSPYPAGNCDRDVLARFVLDTMSALKVERAVVGGNSLGGDVAWRIAALAPARVAALVLVDAAGPAFVPEEVPPGFAFARLPVLNRLGEHLLPRALVAQSVRSVYGDPAKVSDELIDRYFELTLREGNRRALNVCMARYVPGAGAERIAGLKLPTLILWGGLDRLVPPVTGETFERQIAGSKRVVFPSLGHVPQEEDPAATVVPVIEFLRSLPPS